MTASEVAGIEREFDVIIVGSGLAGLTAGVAVARGGRSVLICEKGSSLGGRASTYVDAGLSFNLGPHALYQEGAGVRVLKELGIEFSGSAPESGRWLIHQQRRFPLPRDMRSLLFNRLLGFRGGWAAARILSRLPRINAEQWIGVTVQDWLDRQTRNRAAQAFLRALIRLSTYANAPDEQCAGTAIAQLQMARGGVLYIDGGWNSLVERLAEAATAAGAETRCSQRIEQVLVENDKVSGVRFADGTVCRAANVLVAAPPQTLVDLLPDIETAVHRFARTTRPARAACLNVGLRRLPDSEHLFGLGVDEPTYFSVHSLAARLGPDGTALIHLARYLSPDDRPDPKQVREQLESQLDLMQPGWRDELIAERFFPSLVVVPAIDLAGQRGRYGRPGVSVPEVTGLSVAGDWVGNEGMLADTALASGLEAARKILDQTSEETGIREGAHVHAGRI